MKLNKQNRKRTGFIGGACSLAVVYAASAAPIPLYSTYRQLMGLSGAIFSLAAAVYFAGTIIALLMFARLSNHLGRRPVVLTTLGLAAVGCLIFFHIENESGLLIGRFIQGLACGLASSTITAYVVDNAPASPVWLGAAVISGAPNIGLAVGALASGALKQYGSGSLSLIFGILIAVLAACAVLIAVGPETVTRKRGVIASIVPQIRVPKNIRYLLPAAGATFVGAWSIGGFYQAFSSSMAAEQLGTTNAVAAAVVLDSLIVPIAIGGALVGRLKADRAQRVGMSAYLLSMVMLLISLKAGAMGPFLIASLCVGLTQGAAFTGSMRRLLDNTSQQDRAGVLSAIYLISYSGAAVPNLIVGWISGFSSFFAIAIGYGVLVAVAWLITMIAGHAKQPVCPTRQLS